MRLITDPSGAEVYTADGALIGNTPLDYPRPAAGQSSEVSIRMPGYQDRSLTVSRLTAAEVTVRLERARVASAGRRPQAAVPAPTPQPLAPGPESPRARRRARRRWAARSSIRSDRRRLSARARPARQGGELGARPRAPSSPAQGLSLNRGQSR
ncbi:MAG: PEGA domain-containing protein [Sandaracinaceae bacterium]|nr:PEGA domain-containing protein [Sandaracinaceae bacterium]